jgi:hypothetical protein
MGLFGPSREERLRAAAIALAPYGMVMDARRAGELRQYEPFAELSTPSGYTTAVHGRVDDAPLEAYEYTYATTDSEGRRTYENEIAVVLRHAWIRGTASLRPDQKQWSSAAAALDVLLWIPPFTLVKAIQHLNESKNPDRTIGDVEFDRLYAIHAASDEAARQAIPPSLRSAILAVRFRGVIELRPGVLVYSPYGMGLDERTAIKAIGFAAYFLAALEPKRAHPMR